jgi:uncharacterized cupin superfamily protein
MKPFISLEDLGDYKEYSEGPYKERSCGLSEKIGAQKLAYSVSVVPPGHKVCPFHNHRINEEMFLILEGEGTLRYGASEYRIKKNDIIACPPGGRDVAHQIVNTSNQELKYLCLSTNEPYDICEYPDSNKVLSTAGEQGDRHFTHISRMEDEVDYFHGEK